MVEATTTLTLRLDRTLKADLDRLAGETHRSKSYLAAQAIKDFVVGQDRADIRSTLGTLFLGKPIGTPHGGNQALQHIGRQRRALPDQLLVKGLIELDTGDLGASDHAGRAQAAVDQRHLANNGARTDLRQHARAGGGRLDDSEGS